MRSSFIDPYMTNTLISRSLETPRKPKALWNFQGGGGWGGGGGGGTKIGRSTVTDFQQDLSQHVDTGLVIY